MCRGESIIFFYYYGNRPRRDLPISSSKNQPPRILLWSILHVIAPWNQKNNLHSSKVRKIECFNTGLTLRCFRERRAKGIKDSFEGSLSRMSVLYCVCQRITRVKYASAATLFAIATFAVIGPP